MDVFKINSDDDVVMYVALKIAWIWFWGQIFNNIG